MHETIDLLIDGCAITCVADDQTEHACGHIAIANGRITALGAGAAPAALRDAATRTIDGEGMLATPGLVNCHHHLFQWLTRGHAPDATLFEWLTTLYPTWRHIDSDGVHAAAMAGLSALALSGCTLSTDHHYLFPRDAGDLLEASIDAAGRVGMRFHPTRGSMDLGESRGGLPPDAVCESHDEIMAASEAAIDRWHDASDDAMVQVALAPCSPFSVTRELMADAAALARRRGVRLHTHMAETLDEEAFCREHFGMRPVEYLQACALHPPRRCRGCPLWRDRYGRCPLPKLERPPRCGYRPCSGARCGRVTGRPWR